MFPLRYIMQYAGITILNVISVNNGKHTISKIILNYKPRDSFFTFDIFLIVLL